MSATTINRCQWDGRENQTGTSLLRSAVGVASRLCWLAYVGLIFAVNAGNCLAQASTDIPVRAKDIRVDEKLGSVIRLDTVFQNDRGEPMRLGDIVANGKPMLLTLNYSGCPGLCVAQLDGLVRGLDGLSSLRAGGDFKMVSISIDPRETPAIAAATKAKYVKMLDEKHDAKGWYFMVGDRASIAKIADEVGFRYTYDKEHDRFNHAAVAIAISPEGKITRYLYEVGFEPDTIKMAMIEASEGRIGTPFESFLLWCMHYDANENRYSADARKVLSFAAGGFVLMLVGLSAPFWVGRKRSSPASSDHESDSVNDKENPDRETNSN